MNAVARTTSIAVLVAPCLAMIAGAAEPATAPAAAIHGQSIGGSRTEPWPSEIKGFVPPQPGEHPRLLFRKTDLAKLRAKLKTPEGQAIVKRLREQLNGSDGQSLPPDKMWTISHVAGLGLLYQLTGEQKYADLARESMEKQAFAGVKDGGDSRYAFKGPDGALRAGPALGYAALGYDLCHDGWDGAFRQRVALAIQNYNEGPNKSLPELARGSRHNPKSNHWSMQIGGASLALLAIMDDPGVDMAKIKPLIEVNKKAILTQLTAGYGDGGYFKEGDGTGSMGHTVFVPALQAWKTAAGLDFYNPRPNAQWQVLRWFQQTVPAPGQTKMSDGFYPQRGGYPHNIWMHHYFAVGFGLATEQQQAAMLWFYNHNGVRQFYEKSGGPYDTIGPGPRASILSFVNWPVGLAEKNPQGIIPNACYDSVYGHYAWRNRWQDTNDTVITLLTKGWHPENDFPEVIGIRSQGKNQTWGRIVGGFTSPWAPAKDGSTILTGADGSGFAVDFSQASGAEALLVLTGPAAATGTEVLDAGGVKYSLLALGPGEPPKAHLDGQAVRIGDQRISVANGKIVLAVFNP